MEQAEALLKHVGLTEYEAKALLVLLANGKSTAERISTLGGIPLPRVYDTMNSLGERGIILISKTRPQTFRALDPKRLFDILKEDEKRKLVKRVKTIDDVVPQFLKAVKDLPKINDSGTEETIAYTKRKLNVDKMWSELQENTKKEFLVFAGDMSWISTRRKDIRKATKKGVKYKILSNKPQKEVKRVARQALRAGVELKFVNNSNLIRGIVADSKRVYIIQKRTSDIPEFSDFTSIIINNELIANVFRDYFHSLWRRAQPADKVLKKLK